MWTNVFELKYGAYDAPGDEPASAPEEAKGYPAWDDPVNHPAHYTAGAIECIEAIEAALTPDEFRGFCKGNALKYVWRAGRKATVKQDLEKAIWYLNRCIQDRPTTKADDGPELT